MTDFEQTLREIFGESMDRFNKFSADQKKKFNEKIRELAREAIKDELTRLNGEISELRSRVASLEAERIQGSEEIH